MRHSRRLCSRRGRRFHAGYQNPPPLGRELPCFSPFSLRPGLPFIHIWESHCTHFTEKIEATRWELRQLPVAKLRSLQHLHPPHSLCLILSGWVPPWSASSQEQCTMEYPSFLSHIVNLLYFSGSFHFYIPKYVIFLWHALDWLVLFNNDLALLSP